MFCSHCGEALPDVANFCLKCGARTRKGVEAGVSYPWTWEKEVERALSTVATELEKTFETVKENLRKSTTKAPSVCPACGEKNLPDARFCSACSKELA